MEKNRNRAVSGVLHFKSNTSTQIKLEMDAVYGDPVPSFATVELWTVEFKSNHTSLVNDERSGWPKTATTTDNIEKVYQMVRDDRRIRDRKIAEVVIISKNKFAIY